MRSVSVIQWKRSILFMGWFVGFLLLSGCGIGDQVSSTTEQAVAAVDHAIGELSAANADWQQILRDLARDLPAELQSTIGFEVSSTLERAISASGAEIRCNVDFLRDRVREDLMRIKANLLDQSPPALTPVFCSVESIDMARVNDGRQNSLLIFGYNFDVQNPVQIMLNENGREVDVNAERPTLFVPTYYRMELNLGSNGLQLTPESQYLVIRWDGQVMSEIPIIQPQLPVCVTMPGQYSPNTTTHRPRKHGDGDKDFKGNGPEVEVKVTLIRHQDKKGLDFKIFMEATETVWDWTKVRETKLIRNVYSSPPGFIIDSLVTGSVSRGEYRDSDTTLDQLYPTTTNGPVHHFEIIGDTDGEEAGSRTKVTVVFNTIKFQLKQVDSCR